ncbi:bifunctional indole-3-glycerol phosphate synthase/phosphoribosylanthranilate isomerase [Tepiditoga spiralis]|uniref:N-(5'-phosphoribosyl)anthranilate isomerase n=1 Tax=Tepiditoga spiralis TaxID=2108365 RepID=A0A7G1G4I6_9BACT|nr:hypothetical protein [Tepiditoga spiralis]BBE31015.1 bifunctional indole-3-glycerol phosphate synthase/phosphoribosylanthranilate isomerase [Tepiditoga spiralis]
MYDILKEIIDKRQIENVYPQKRTVPVLKPKNNLVIMEIKKSSPSKGKIKNFNILEQTNLYIENGVNCISVLTEKNFFGGSLNDLIKIKNKYPNILVLRKDFLTSKKDIEISYNVGADIILLITSLFIKEKNGLKKMKELKDYAEKLGMTCLIEIHSKKELNFALKLEPKLLGINSRDLNTFKIKKELPFELKKYIKKIKVIYESGINNYLDSFSIGVFGFNGILCGTSVIENKKRIPEIIKGFNDGKNNQNKFYKYMFNKIYLKKELVVKVCGLTNLKDTEFVIKKGANIVGFIMAKSLRQVNYEFLKNTALKIKNNMRALVITKEYLDQAIKAYNENLIDVVQVHGEFNENKLKKIKIPYYKAVNLKDKLQIKKSIFTLYDAFSENTYGGTGKTLSNELIKAIKEKESFLAIAGGINEKNIQKILKYTPNMIDLSSGLEKVPGKKDKEKVEKFFYEVKKWKK